MEADAASILRVEDNPNDALLIQRTFAKAKAASGLFWVEDGEKAMAYLAGEGRYGDRRRYPYPALMLLDLKLPRKSGFEVLDWVRGRPRLRSFQWWSSHPPRDDATSSRLLDILQSNAQDLVIVPEPPFSFSHIGSMTKGISSV